MIYHVTGYHKEGSELFYLLWEKNKKKRARNEIRKIRLVMRKRFLKLKKNLPGKPNY